MTGTIGSGGPQVRLETMNGRIILISAEGRGLSRDQDLAGDDDGEDEDDDDDNDEDDEDDSEDEDAEDDDPR